jgi:hypothetical protein
MSNMLLLLGSHTFTPNVFGLGEGGDFNHKSLKE